MIRILLVDDHKVIRDGLRLLLDDYPDMQVVGEADHGRQALALVEELPVDVVVMDVAMPELNGIEATRRLLERHPEIKVVALSMYSDPRILAEMLHAGAAGLVVKGSVTEDLVQAIRAVRSGEQFLAPEAEDAIAASGPVDSASGRAATGLTQREIEVLQLVAEGGTTRSIGVQLDISAKTVDTHRQNIMRKLQVRTVAGLTKYAVREGITSL